MLLALSINLDCQMEKDCSGDLEKTFPGAFLMLCNAGFGRLSGDNCVMLCFPGAAALMMG